MRNVSEKQRAAKIKIRIYAYVVDGSRAGKNDLRTEFNSGGALTRNISHRCQNDIVYTERLCFERFLPLR